MATSTAHPASTLRRPTIEATPASRIRQLIDNGTLYIAQNLNPVQFATLQAIAGRILQTTPGYTPAFRHPLPVAFDYQLGLDELDTISRTRTGYSFAELPDELQDAILSLISTGDLTTRKLDIASWLEALRAIAA